jgi:hypothetical protein
MAGQQTKEKRSLHLKVLPPGWQKPSRVRRLPKQDAEIYLRWGKGVYKDDLCPMSESVVAVIEEGNQLVAYRVTDKELELSLLRRFESLSPHPAQPVLS